VLVLIFIAPVAVCNTGRGWNYCVKGVEALNKGLFDEAIADFTKAIEAGDDYYLLRGRAYMGKGQHDQAIADYDEALKLDPKNEFAKKDRDIAIELKKSSHKFDYRGFQDIDQGEAFITYHGAELGPAHSGTGWDDCVKGIKALNKGLFDKAVANFTKAIELEPNRDSYYQLRGRAYMGKGQHDQAIADYDKALKLAEFDDRKPSIAKDRDLAIKTKKSGEKIVCDHQEVDEARGRLSIWDCF
jgi:tetratricopeptide (TPR) repeat protein